MPKVIAAPTVVSETKLKELLNTFTLTLILGSGVKVKDVFPFASTRDPTVPSPTELSKMPYST